MSEWIKQKDFVCKEVWEQSSGKRDDGSEWTLQKILNENDHTLLLWSMDDQTGIIKPGIKYSVTGIKEKVNRDGYDEYSTGKFSTIGPISSMDVLAPKQKTLPTTVDAYRRHAVTFEDNVLAQLGLIRKQLDDLAEMIQFYE